MICSDKELLSAYLDGETNRSQSDAVRLHLEGCAGCRTSLAAMKSSKKSLASLAVPSIPPELAAALSGMARSVQTPYAAAPPSARGKILSAALAACLALVFWARHEGFFVVRLDIPADLLIAAHNQYALTVPLAPAEKIMAEMPVRLAGEWRGDRDVY